MRGLGVDGRIILKISLRNVGGWHLIGIISIGGLKSSDKGTFISLKGE